MRDALLVPALGVMILVQAPCTGARLFIPSPESAAYAFTQSNDECVECAGFFECIEAWYEYLASLATGQEPDTSIYDACFEDDNKTTTTTEP